MPTPMMMDEDQMGPTTDAEHAIGGGGEEQEPTSVFLSKEAVHGKSVKPGDKLELTVKDVDPETGDIEAVCEYGEHEQGSESDSMSGFDKEFPEEKGY